ncbi:probable carbohydrate esterase At4g34215 [Olea europaea var. sylvestris]|uniref:probable carbohydrate esterase At4g34215 n=1 Tax=Olea europaea var. sylvestris TaxID=158386 RepID=UPI000C1D7FE5|nr:probable carbohydrate esterase At4g34215 [Olea europaea var. sylvestris]
MSKYNPCEYDPFTFYTAMKRLCTKIFLLFLLLLLLYCYSGFRMIGQENPYPETVEKVNIFILGGQSNMAGRGGVDDKEWDEYVPTECMRNRRILRLNENSELEEAEEPLHSGIDVNKTCGVGPGMAFANAILEKDPNFGVIVLVPCAIGGTSITAWSGSNSSLRSQMIKRTTEALNYGGKIRAILWYQGEKDTETEAASYLFPSEYQVFLYRLYQELKNPQIPFVQVALASGQGEADWLENVRASQIAVKNVITVDAMGLQVGEDGLHLTTNSQVCLGRMLADAFFSTIS